jgi:hypothetical protein
MSVRKCFPPSTYRYFYKEISINRWCELTQEFLEKYLFGFPIYALNNLNIAIYYNDKPYFDNIVKYLIRLSSLEEAILTDDIVSILEIIVEKMFGMAATEYAKAKIYLEEHYQTETKNIIKNLISEIQNNKELIRNRNLSLELSYRLNYFHTLENEKQLALKICKEQLIISMQKVDKMQITLNISFSYNRYIKTDFSQTLKDARLLCSLLKVNTRDDFSDITKELETTLIKIDTYFTEEDIQNYTEDGLIFRII